MPTSNNRWFMHANVHKLNIGCGKNTLPSLHGWVNLDMADLPGVNVIYDLEQAATIPLPFQDDHFGFMLMSHVLEHITKPLPLMQELHRVCKPNGRLVVRVPYGASDIAFEDPTHVRQYFLNSFMYFGQPAYARADYGYRGDWAETERVLIISDQVDKEIFPSDPSDQLQFLRTFWNVVEEFVVVLRPVKPARQPGEGKSTSVIRIGYRHELGGLVE